MTISGTQLEFPLRAGVINGAAAYVAGLVTSTALFAFFGRTAIAEIAGSAIPRATESFAWVFYGGHGVDIVVDGTTLNFARTVASNSALYFLVPLVLLLASGHYVASTLDDHPSHAAGFVAGSSITLGYLPLVAAGAVLFEYDVTHATVTIPVLEAVLLAGIVYPVLVGGIGGAVAAHRS